MLDGNRYYLEFPDEEPERLGKVLLSEELLLTLAAIEREISAFIGVQNDEADTATPTGNAAE